MSVEIEGQDFTLYVDYDRDKLGTLSYLGQIDYFRRRVTLILIEPLRRMIGPGVQEAFFEEDRCNHMLCVTTLVCCGIEALGGFYRGRTPNKQTFRDFVLQYMSDDFKLRNNGQMFVDILRDSFRNGLAHGFAIKAGGIQGPSSPYFEIIPELGLEIDAWKLSDDFQQAFAAYVKISKRKERTLL